MTTATTPTERRVAAALFLADVGYGILETQEGQKRPLGDAWQKLYVRDPDDIRVILGRPRRQFGVYPPAGSGLFVIDFDVRAVYEVLAPLLPPTLAVETSEKEPGWRGRHVYLRLPGDVDEASVPRTFEGGEIRVAGSGQVVGPWGIHPNGMTYEPVGRTRTIAVASTALLDALRSSHERKVGAPREARGPQDPGWTVPEPGRHDFLVARGRYLRGVGLSGARLRDELRRLNTERCSPPKDEAEVDAIAAWVESNIGDDPPAAVRETTSDVVDSLSDGESYNPWAERAFPDPPSDLVYHGIMGEVVAALAPHTEADPLTLLTTGLTMAGVSMGLSHRVHGLGQGTNLFVIHVGESGSGGRKGTGLAVMRESFKRIYPALVETIWAPSVSSGEGIVSHLVKNVPEKRVLMVEEEFARPLTLMTRQGATLSSELRRAFDGVPLGYARSREEAMVTEHHVALIGQITPVELRAKLDGADAANGFANRLLFIAVRRRQVVMHPESPWELIAPFVHGLHQAIVEASGDPAEVSMDAAARDRWETFREVEEANPRLGLAGALTGRVDAQTLRLALVYALLDRDHLIRAPHLEAALALTDYGVRSVLWAFGDSTGNPHSDALRELLQEGPIGWEDAKRQLGMRTAAEMNEAVRVLVEAELAELVKEKKPGGGRRTRWIREYLSVKPRKTRKPHRKGVQETTSAQHTATATHPISVVCSVCTVSPSDHAPGTPHPSTSPGLTEDHFQAVLDLGGTEVDPHGRPIH